MTTDAVLVEVLSFVAELGPRTRERGLALVDKVLSDSRITVLTQDRDLFSAGLAPYRRRMDNGIQPHGLHVDGGLRRPRYRRGVEPRPSLRARRPGDPALRCDARRSFSRPDTIYAAMADATSPIGMFDSGVGGLAVLAEVRRLLPGEDVVYYADTAYFPYGPRPAAEIRERAEAITRELLERGAKLIVVACNTATSAAIAHLRATFDVPFVGHGAGAEARGRAHAVRARSRCSSRPGRRAARSWRRSSTATARRWRCRRSRRRGWRSASRRARIDDDETRALRAALRRAGARRRAPTCWCSAARTTRSCAT